MKLLFLVQVEVAFVDPTAMLENAEVEAELLPSAGGSMAGVLKGSGATGREGGC